MGFHTDHRDLFVRHGTAGVGTRQWREHDQSGIGVVCGPTLVDCGWVSVMGSIVPNTTARIRKSLHELIGDDTVSAVTDHSQLMYHRPIEKSDVLELL